MPDNTANRVAPILCWIMQPALDKNLNPDFQWSWQRWQMTGRIIAGRARRTVSSKGDASFRVVRETRREPNDTKQVTRSDDVYVGSYVAITAGKLGDVLSTGILGLKPEAVLWWGWVTAFQAERVKGTTESIGDVTALEVGHLFDRMQVTRWSRKAADSAYPDPLQSPPTANIAGTDGQVIGNAFPATDAKGNSVYLFGRTPNDCGTDPTVSPGTFWTRWRLLRHLVKVAKPLGLPDLNLIPQDETTEPVDPSDPTKLAGFLNIVDKATTEVFQLQEPTFAGHLDLLLPRPLAVGWRADIGRTAWTIVPYSLAETNAYGLPANASQVDVDLTDDDNVVSVGTRESADDLPDQIILEGGRCVFGGTMSFFDNTAKTGWTDSQETTYKNGAKAATDYAGLSTANKKIRNRAVRAGPHIRDVFTRYMPNFTGNGDITFKKPAVDQGGTGIVLPFCPDVSIDDDGVTVRINASVTRSPYLPSASLMRTLPWPEGLKTDGTDPRNAEAKAQPQYLPPRVFRYDKSDSNHPWLDLIADNGATTWFPTQVDVDDHGPALRITTTPQEALAKGHFTGAEPADIDPDNSASNAISYGALVFTIAMESDQRVRYVITRPGVNENAPRRQLKITDERYQFWCVHLQTILGLKADGTPDRVLPPSGSGTVDGNAQVLITRNDWPAIVRRAKQIAAFTYRSRVSVSIKRLRPDAPPAWAVIGTMLRDVIEAPAAGGTQIVDYEAATVVEEIAFDFGASPRIDINTNLPDSFVGQATGAGADRGGAVSVSASGTLAQQASAARSDDSDLRRLTANTPVIAPKGGSGANSVYTLVIGGGNVLSDGSTQGIKYAGSAPATVPSLYDPNTSPACIDGVGWATLFKDNVSQGKVLVAHFSGNGSPLTLALVANQIPLTNVTTVSIPLVSDATQSVTCYVPYSP